MRSWRNAPAVVPPGSLADDPIGKEACRLQQGLSFGFVPRFGPVPLNCSIVAIQKSGDLKQIPAGFQVVGV